MLFPLLLLQLFLPSVILRLNSLPQTADEGISSGDASVKPTTETLTVEAAAATAGSDIGGLEREIPETEEQAPDQQRRTEEERTDPIPPSATTSNLHCNNFYTPNSQLLSIL